MISTMLESTLTLVIGLLTLITAYLSWFFYDHYQYWKRRNVPNLPPEFPFGNIKENLFARISFPELMMEAYNVFKERGEKKHFGMYIFYAPIYVPMDPEIIKDIMIKDVDYFPNRGLHINPEDDPLSEHLLTMEDARWKTLRSKLPSSFTSAKMKKMFEKMTDMIEPYTRVLDTYAEKDEPVNLKIIATRFATDIVASCFFGINTNTLKKDNLELVSNGRKFFDEQFNLTNFAVSVLFPRKFLKFLKHRSFARATEDFLMGFFKDILQYRKKTGPIRGDLTDALVKMTERHEDQFDYTGKNVMEPLDTGTFVAQMNLFLAAGFETSSSTQTFALYELGRKPELQTRLRNEINRVLEKHENKLTYEALEEMKYLDNVLQETMRLYPIFGTYPRYCKYDYKVPGTDLTLEAGTFILIPAIATHRDAEYFPDPETFDPERFNEENKGNWPSSVFLPFGDGPRICLGKRFGTLETKVGILSVIKNYEVSVNEKTTKDMHFIPEEMMLRKTGDVWLNLKKVPSN